MGKRLASGVWRLGLSQTLRLVHGSLVHKSVHIAATISRRGCGYLCDTVLAASSAAAYAALVASLPARKALISAISRRLTRSDPLFPGPQVRVLPSQLGELPGGVALVRALALTAWVLRLVSVRRCRRQAV